MNRGVFAELAADTVRIVGEGMYEPPNAAAVRIRESVQNCLAGTRYFEPDELRRIRDEILCTSPPAEKSVIEVCSETTLEGARALYQVPANCPVAVLNFASARKPGGGFLGGARAQEESLARSSALHASLLRAPEFYAAHQRNDDLRYSDRMIVSPGCPVFRDDDGFLLETPYDVHFITSAAPNAGAIASNQPHALPTLRATFEMRAELVLALAVRAGCPAIVLGAWGCGVFRNDPVMVADVFAKLLLPGRAWHGRFARVRFSIYDTTASQNVYQAFAAALAT